MNSYVSVVNGNDYKKAMRQLAGATCVITATHQNQLSGLTVTSVTSVAIDPAELLVCINTSASAWPLIQQSMRFGVNILGTHHQHVANQFAGVDGCQGSNRYANARWIEKDGILLLEDALARLSCRVEDVIFRHSHAVVLGRVEFIEVADTAISPLVYWQGTFGAFSHI